MDGRWVWGCVVAIASVAQLVAAEQGEVAAAQLWSNVATTLEAAGDLSAAVALRRRIVASLPDGPARVGNRQQLAQSLMFAGEPLQARAHFEAVAAAMPADQPGRYRALHNWALCERRLGEPERARQLARDAIVLATGELGGRHIHVATILQTLASLHEVDDALPLYYRALEITEDAHADDQRAAELLSNLAEAEREVGRTDAARRRIDQVLQWGAEGHLRSCGRRWSPKRPRISPRPPSRR